jgi:hypothetical protein
MAITIEEMWQGRGANGAGLTESSATRRWRVRTDNKLTSWETIQSYGISIGKFPNRFDPHPDNGYLTARVIKSENQDDSPFHWIVTVEYSSKPLKEQEREKENPDPLDRRAKRTWSTTVYQQRVTQDINGEAVVNSEGDYFPDPPEKDASHWTVTVTKNVSTVPAWILSYNDCPINDDEWEIGGVTVDPGCARLYEIRIGDEQEENGITYMQLSYTVEFRKEGWVQKYLNQGFRIQGTDADDNEVLVHAQIWNEEEKQYEKATAPVMIDKAFHVVISRPTPSNVDFMEYDIYEEKDFSVLPVE